MVAPVADDLVAELRRDVERSALRLRNGLKFLAGVGRPTTGATPRDQVWAVDKVRLFRYRSDSRTRRVPLLLVHSLVSKSYVFDIAPGNSFVEALLGRGHDVYLLDWGIPDELESRNTLETYTDDYIPAAVDAVLETADADEVDLFGYCFGGVLCLLYAAGHTADPIRSLSVLATPVDFTKMGTMATLLAEGNIDPRDLLDPSGNVPADVMFNGFRMRRPTDNVTAYVDLWQHLWNDDYLDAHRLMAGWAKDHIPFPGAAFVQTAQILSRGNRLAVGRVPLAGGDVDLADIAVPFHSIIGARDDIVPPEASRGLPDLVGAGDGTETELPGGHVGMVVGRSAQKHHIPKMAAWIESLDT